MRRRPLRRSEGEGGQDEAARRGRRLGTLDNE